MCGARHGAETNDLPISNQGDTMPKYIIERDVPGVGDLSAREQKAGALKSRRTIDDLGPDIRWQHSYICGDKTYCVYIASG